MVTAKQLATVAAMSDADAAAIAYLEAAGGDAEQALRWVVEDLLRTEADLRVVRAAVSCGYVHANLFQRDVIEQRWVEKTLARGDSWSNFSSD